MPAVLDHDAASVGEREGGDVERVAEGVLGDVRAGIAVHAATGIGRDLLDLDDAIAEPAHRRRLHGLGEPAVERRDDRTGQRRRRLHYDRTDGGHRIAARGPEWWWRIRLLIGLLRVRLLRIAGAWAALRLQIDVVLARPHAGRIEP